MEKGFTPDETLTVKDIEEAIATSDPEDFLAKRRREHLKKIEGSLFYNKAFRVLLGKMGFEAQQALMGTEMPDKWLGFYKYYENPGEGSLKLSACIKIYFNFDNKNTELEITWPTIYQDYTRPRVNDANTYNIDNLAEGEERIRVSCKVIAKVTAVMIKDLKTLIEEIKKL